jgi:predicted alpha/beta hydrolase family esterase
LIGWPDNVQRIHLVGHSFGCRVVTAAAATSTTDKLQSMSLLQAAFSHNGFSKSMNGFFRSVVDNHRIKGPIVVTYTPNDRAVGIRLSGCFTIVRHGRICFWRRER